MDPLTAFSLTCGVIQVVDFSARIVVKCRQIYKDGATSEHTQMKSMAEHLKALATDMKLPSTVQGLGSANQLYHHDEELLKLAERCSETATELINELQELSIQGRQRKRDALRKAVKVVWKKDTIENIQKSLESYRRTLDTSILISLSSRQHVHLILSEQSDGIRNLDRKIQNLIIGVSENQNTFDELKDLITAENASSKEHVSREFQKHREKIATEEYHRRLIESLYFPDMHAREEGMDEAHNDTFEWIFDKPSNEVRPWHNFIDWLEEGHGTYWISGKAGSGKSTLMNFVCHDPRTEAALKIWSGTNAIFTPNFFFWSPGSQLQKSLVGLLRSLIYQILERFPDLMPKLAEATGFPQHGLRQLPTWTEQRLRATLQTLLSVRLEQCRLCIFIDGLDEFHGDHVTLLNLISSFRGNSKVKFCLSSRPYSLFKHELGSSPMLKLQDLTEPDIQIYVSDKLEWALMNASWVSYSSSWIEDAVDTVVEKAEGVFLWVRLAVRDQLEGIRNGDDAEQLRKRLQILPTEIEEVYVHMLHGIDKVYRTEVAQYIRPVLDVKSVWTLFEIALAQHKRIDDILLFSEEISIWNISQHCKSVGERIAATCKGFLEVRGIDDIESWGSDEQRSDFLEHRTVSIDFEHQTTSIDIEHQTIPLDFVHRTIPLEQREELRKMKYLHQRTRVEFLHRTAFDFFNDNKHGKDFLNIPTIANKHPQISYVKALLAALRIFTIWRDDLAARDWVRRIMINASAAEEAIGVAQPALMDLIDRSITLLWERTPGRPPNLHWYRPWGEPRNIRFRTERNGHHQQRTCWPVDFLGLAAWYGHDEYGQHMLDSLSGKLEPEHGTADYLLGCSVSGLVEGLGMKSNLKLIPALLKRGADPNKGLLESTVWGLFLQVLYYACLQYDEETWECRKTDWSNTVKAFLKSGANVHETLSTRVASSPSGYVIELHVSTRSFLQWCFAKENSFFEVEDPLVASGATLYSKCIRLRLKARNGGRSKRIVLKPSEQQSSQLTKLCEQALQQHKLPELQSIYLLDIEQLYDQAPTDDNQSDTDIDSMSDLSSIDIPSSPTDEDEGSFYSANSSLQDED